MEGCLFCNPHFPDGFIFEHEIDGTPELVGEDREGFSFLEARKLYEKLPDKETERDNQVRIIDESGEDYLYPAKFFAPISLPMQTRDRIFQKTA